MDEWEEILAWLERYAKVWLRFLEHYMVLRDQHPIHEKAYQWFLQVTLPIIHKKVIHLRKYLHRQNRQEGRHFTVCRYSYSEGVKIEKHWVPANRLENGKDNPKHCRLVTWRTDKERKVLGVDLFLTKIGSQNEFKELNQSGEVVEYKCNSVRIITDVRALMSAIDLTEAFSQTRNFIMELD